MRGLRLTSQFRHHSVWTPVIGTKQAANQLPSSWTVPLISTHGLGFDVLRTSTWVPRHLSRRKVQHEGSSSLFCVEARHLLPEERLSRSRPRSRPRSDQKADDGLSAAPAHHAETISPVSMSKNLCAVCNGIFTGLLVEGFDRRMPHHPSVAALKRAAEEGCSVCKMIAHQLPSHIIALGDSGLSVPDPISWTLRWYGGEESIDQQKKGYIDYGGIIIKSSYFVSCFRLLGTRSKSLGHPLRNSDRLKGQGGHKLTFWKHRFERANYHPSS